MTESESANYDANRIQPYSENKRFWQYHGEPVNIFGASDEDNLFQWVPDRLLPHLDALVAAGGNQVRNTMSDRDDGDLRAFAEVEPGKYDLSQLNAEYWDRFDFFLRETQKRGIFVQIEVWDRFDHSREQWTTDPYNPKNNINYGYEESGFDEEYPRHPSTNVQAFFYTPPTLRDNTVVRPYQEAFVKKLLEIATQYDHVLYCIDNETNGSEEWATYWAEFLRAKSEALGRSIEITQMWDDWELTSPIHQRTVGHPERYDFIDLSQNNQMVGQANWDNARLIYNQIADNPRPINATKIYGSPEWNERWEGRTTENAIGNFWRCQLGGFATSRFHRPGGGIGLSDLAKTQLTVARAWVGQFDRFKSIPDNNYELLGNRSENEAYANAIPGEAWTVFFPTGGDVVLKTGEANTTLTLKYADLRTGAWSAPSFVKTDAQGEVSLRTPGNDLTLALIKK